MTRFLFFTLLAAAFISCNNPPAAAPEDANAVTRGKELFNKHCASCHRVKAEITGPALMNVHQRWPDTAALYRFIKNSTEEIARGGYPQELFNRFNQTVMPPANLTDEQISDILTYIRDAGAKP